MLLHVFTPFLLEEKGTVLIVGKELIVVKDMTMELFSRLSFC